MGQGHQTLHVLQSTFCCVDVYFLSQRLDSFLFLECEQIMSTCAYAAKKYPPVIHTFYICDPRACQVLYIKEHGNNEKPD